MEYAVKPHSISHQSTTETVDKACPIEGKNYHPLHVIFLQLTRKGLKPDFSSAQTGTLSSPASMNSFLATKRSEIRLTKILGSPDHIQHILCMPKKEDSNWINGRFKNELFQIKACLPFLSNCIAWTLWVPFSDRLYLTYR